MVLSTDIVYSVFVIGWEISNSLRFTQNKEKMEVITFLQEREDDECT